MSSKPPASARPVKKPVPAPVKPQNVPTKKPVPVPPKPQQTKSAPPAKPPPPPTANPPRATKKPVPRPVTSQNKPQFPAPKANTVSKGPSSKPPLPKAAPQPAAQEPKADNWISRTVQGQVQRAGDYAGGWVNSIGDKVNGIGEGIGNTITNQTRYWGQGVSGYGNDIKDAVGVGGPRVATAGNPLGIAGQGQGKGSAPGAKAEKGVRNAGKGSASDPLGIGG